LRHQFIPQDSDLGEGFIIPKIILPGPLGIGMDHFMGHLAKSNSVLRKVRFDSRGNFVKIGVGKDVVNLKMEGIAGVFKGSLAFVVIPIQPPFFSL
jgi:hypothetical protein